jgi:hypothetical protein
LAVHFTIKGAQSFPLITHLIPHPKLSQNSLKLSPNLSQILFLSLSTLGPAVKEEEFQSSLSPVGKSFSFSISLSLSRLYCEKRKRRRRKIGREEEEKKKKKREKKKGRNIFGF